MCNPAIAFVGLAFSESHDHLRLEIHLRKRPPLLRLSPFRNVSSALADEMLALDAPELSLAGGPSRSTGVAGMLGPMMERTLWMAWPCVLMELAWLTVRRCLDSMERLRRFTACSAERSSWDMDAFGERSASGCGRVVLKSKDVRVSQSDIRPMTQSKLCVSTHGGVGAKNYECVFHLLSPKGSGKPVSRLSRQAFDVGVGGVDMICGTVCWESTTRSSERLALPAMIICIDIWISVPG